MDDGADVVSVLHTERKDLLSHVIGGTEETTTGVIRRFGARAIKKGSWTSRQCSYRCAEGSGMSAGQELFNALVSSSSTRTRAPGYSHTPRSHRESCGPSPVWFGPNNTTRSGIFAQAYTAPATAPE
jgi:hypothetical protein